MLVVIQIVGQFKRDILEVFTDLRGSNLAE